MTRLDSLPIDSASLLAAVQQPHCGGIALFVGTVRDLTGEQVTTHLEYEAFGPMAEKMLAEVEQEVRQRWPVGGFAAVHRVGRLEIGEAAVAIAVSCPHRSEAFEACRYAIDRIKEVVPIWKKEHGPHGPGEWVHPDGASPVLPINPEGN